MYPTKKQQQVLKQWLGTTRYVYNNALNGIKNNKESFDAYKLRDKYVSKNFNQPFGLYELFYNPKFEYVPHDWELETPKDIRAGAIRDLCKARKTCLSNLKNGNISKFKINFRSKRKPCSVELPKSSIKIGGKKVKIFPRKLNSSIKLSNDRCLKKLVLNHDCRMTFDKNRWYLIVPIDVQKKRYNFKPGTSCGIDPGSRKFVTVYGDDETTKVHVNKGYFKKRQSKLDFFQSLTSLKKMSKSKYKRLINRIYNRLDDSVDEMHNKTINELVNSFETIYIPIFESQKMIGSKKLNKGTKRNLMQLKHFKFRTKLMNRGYNVSVCTEEYTSKTCTSCGNIKWLLGCSETYHCDKCSVTLDRDINGARNILIKCLM